MKRWMTVLLACAMVITLAACGGKDKDKLEAVKESGKLVLGTSADYPPFEFHKTIDGKDQIVGSDIEIAKQIAKDLGVELEIQDMKFDGLLLALNADKVDLIISGMTPTAKRAESVDFSNVYYNAEQVVLVKKGGLQLQSYDDLKGKKIAVQKGSTQEGVAKEIEGAKLTSLAKISELILELQSGRSDAVIAEKPVAEQYVKNQPDIEIANVTVPAVEETGWAIAVKKNNKPLVDELNKSLDKLKQDGSLDRFIVEANELIGE